MNKQLPKISIVTPSFNQSLYLEQSIQSVLSQGYPNLEYIVIDGGSTDGSTDILRKYNDRITFWISAPDQGQSDALNQGFSRTTGDIIGWLNSDDTYQPGTFTEVANIFTRNGMDIIMSEYFGLMDESGKIFSLKKNEYLDHDTLIRFWKTNGMTVNQPSVLFRRELISNMHPVFDVSLCYAMDYDLWLRLSRDRPFHVVPGHWANYRLHQDSKSGTGFDKFVPEWLVVSRRFWGRPFSMGWYAHWLGRHFYNQLRKLVKLIKKTLFPAGKM